MIHDVIVESRTKHRDQLEILRLVSGNADDLEELNCLIKKEGIPKNIVSLVWIETISRMLEENDKDARKKLHDLGLNISNIDHPQRDAYEDLFSLVLFAESPYAYAQVIKVGAHIARMERRYKIDMSKRHVAYIELAKKCLEKVAAKGSEEPRKYAVIVLRNLWIDTKVKPVLLNTLRNDESDVVKKAAGESLGYIRIKEEVKRASSDLLMLRFRYPSTTIQADILKCIYAAVDKIYKSLNDPKKTGEIKIALIQLSSFKINSETIRNLFDEESLDIIEGSIENALLHALTKGSTDIRVEALQDLEKRGSKRLCLILRKIIEREEEGSEVREAAFEVHKVMQEKRWNFEPPLPLVFCKKISRTNKPHSNADLADTQAEKPFSKRRSFLAYIKTKITRIRRRKKEFVSQGS
jgi:hypothetical protein